MRISKVLLIILLCLSVLTGPVLSQTIKIGSIAPEQSLWDKTLKKVATEWKKISKGKVKLDVLTGGTAGSAADIKQKMAGGELEGAFFFNRGIIRIYPDIFVLDIPLLITSQGELDYIMSKMKTIFEKGISEKGYQVISFSSSGWIMFFSKEPVTYPQDMKKHKFSFTTSSPAMENTWRDLGFHIVPTEFKDLMMALQRRDIDAFFLSPVVACDGGYFKKAPNMASLKVNPEYWCLMLTKKAWGTIPEQYKEDMLTAACNLFVDLDKEIQKRENEAIEKMEDQGLMINKLPVDAIEKCHIAVEQGMKTIKGEIISEDVYKQVLRYLKEYREKNKNPPFY